MLRLRAIGAIAALLASSGCERDTRPDQWDAYIYSPSDNETLSEHRIRGFKSF